ncbi:MAG: hypothetical protein N2038_12720 [Geminicoccaceae bacterium]|nr:hypothetical protein [Geminicoccaceae bacterium]MCX7631096.1 hypothetical protein [Geminicoccaceae bacterium]MDW8124940.1 hypothetical protein [Geminicoccaceae bacterium]MDW8340988.1 hypothetical protein [Geminicoccaceae bacterium]
MQATLTLVLCLVNAPDQCEVREKRVDALACVYAGANVIAAETPPGYRVRHARCVPHRPGRGSPGVAVTPTG